MAVYNAIQWVPSLECFTEPFEALGDLNRTECALCTLDGGYSVCMLICCGLIAVVLLLQSGDTALHLACFHGYLDIAKLLVKHGANLHIVNKVSSSGAEHRTLQALYVTCTPSFSFFGPPLTTSLGWKDSPPSS